MTANDLVTAEDIAAFRRDGAIVLRAKFATEWLELLRAGIDADLANPTGNFTRHTKDPRAPAYFEDYWAWNKIPQFRDFVLNSPCAPLAASLLGAPKINLVMDNWFLREAGSTSRPPFHQDLSYFDFEGTMCVLWLPLEPVSKDNGIAFVKGSHLWDKLFMRVRFADGHPSYEPTEVAGRTYHPPPDVNADPQSYDLLQWDMDLGDCIFFDMRTLHGGLVFGDPDGDGAPVYPQDDCVRTGSSAIAVTGPKGNAPSSRLPAIAKATAWTVRFSHSSGRAVAPDDDGHGMT